MVDFQPGRPSGPAVRPAEEAPKRGTENATIRHLQTEAKTVKEQRLKPSHVTVNYAQVGQLFLVCESRW